MKKSIIILYAFISALLFSTCTTDETVNQDCFVCAETSKAYCISQGDDFYTVAADGQELQIVPLNTDTWAEIKIEKQAACQEITDNNNQDCYTCQSSNTQYCYFEGNDFYTVSINNTAPTQISRNGVSWQSLKVAFMENCEDDQTTEDCYTCVSEETQYCYTEGNDFYTSTINNNETQVPLNGQTWAEIKTSLEESCPAVTSGNIVGNWQVIDFNGTSESTSTTGGISSTIVSEQHNLSNQAFIEFTETPNEYIGTGELDMQLTSTIDGGTPIITEYTTQPFNNGTWSITGNILTTTQAGDSSDSTILELTDTTLKLRVFTEETTTTNDITTEVVLEFFYTLERQ